MVCILSCIPSQPHAIDKTCQMNLGWFLWNPKMLLMWVVLSSSKKVSTTFLKQVGRTYLSSLFGLDDAANKLMLWSSARFWTSFFVLLRFLLDTENRISCATIFSRLVQIPTSKISDQWTNRTQSRGSILSSQPSRWPIPFFVVFVWGTWNKTSCLGWQLSRSPNN